VFLPPAPASRRTKTPIQKDFPILFIEIKNLSKLKRKTKKDGADGKKTWKIHEKIPSLQR